MGPNELVGRCAGALRVDPPEQLFKPRAVLCPLRLPDGRRVVFDQQHIVESDGTRAVVATISELAALFQTGGVEHQGIQFFFFRL